MEHTTYLEQIVLWLDNELEPSQVSQLKVHLAECPACQESYQAMQRTDSFLRQAATVMIEPEPGFTSRFETRLVRARPHLTGKAWLGVGVLVVSSLGLMVVGAVVGGITLLNLWAALIDTNFFYSWLGEFGGVVNQTRMFINLGGALYKAFFFATQQPLFWISVPIFIGLGWLWTRLMKAPIQQLPQTAKFLL